MTEQEWLESTDPTAMLAFLFGPLDKVAVNVCLRRKNLLLTCACFSRLTELLPDSARQWQAHAELAADGNYEEDRLHGEGEVADVDLGSVYWNTTIEGSGRLRALFDLWTWTDIPQWPNDGSEIYREAERKAQAALVRDIYGEPLRAVILDLSWLAWNDGIVVRCAQSIYDDRAFDRLPILADALSEAGCTNADILSHCRSEGPHVRGCWVVDLILGRSN